MAIGTKILSNYENLTFTDDFMFGKVMGDVKLCQSVLETLLQQPIGELTEATVQRAMKQTTEGKTIILDVYTKAKEAIYDAEMQNLNHQSLDSLDLPKRSRFYQSEIDTDFLQKGNSYKELPENNIIFICTFDPCRRNEAVYHFSSRLEADPSIELKDGIHKYFFNCTYKGEKMPDDLADLYRYIQTGTPGSSLTERIDSAVKEAQKNEKWRSEYMRERVWYEDAISIGKSIGIEEGIEKGIEKGIEQGIEQERINTLAEKHRADEAEAEAKALREELERLKAEK